MIAFLINLLLLSCTTPALSNPTRFVIYAEAMNLDLNVEHEENNANPEWANEIMHPNVFRYRECQKNVALNGGHRGPAVYDGCGEFMPSGDAGTLEAMICIACKCHRSFHRKEEIGQQQEQQQQQQVDVVHHYQHNYVPAGNIHVASSSHSPHEDNRTQLLALPSAEREYLKEMVKPCSSGGDGTSSTNKRFRTRFTREQKDKMLRFAAAIGWRKSKDNEGAVNEFCEESGIKRQTFIVWMHNNKHTLGKKL